MNVDFPLPVEKQKARYWLFGDEAYRDIDDTYLLTYSLVGTNNVRLLKVEEDIKDFKLRLCPSVSPDSWRLHMKDIWPENERTRHPLFNCWDYNFVRDFVDGFFELIRGFDEAFVKYNVSAIYHKSKSKKQRRLEKREVRHQAYSVLLMKVIDEATKSGVQPNFMFDSDKDSEGDNVIHGWAKDVFQGSQLNLLYCFLARGIEIPEPVFVSPASRPCLEVADFMSYVVARYCYRRIKGELTDLDPKQLGPVTYIGFDPSGDMLFQKSTGYPWHFFYGSV